MLLPSALSCDSSHPKTRYQASLFASPPLSPQSTTTSTTITSIYSTCRALQSMLTTPNQLPSPPTTHSEAPVKLRLRARKPESNENGSLTPRRKITKRERPAQAPRGANKRRRAVDDEMDRNTFGNGNMDDDSSCGSDDENANTNIPAGPSTPKRQRIAPEVLPMGLERGDFHSLHLQQVPEPHPQSQSQMQYPVLDNSAVIEEWSDEDDRLLVELVLEKLKLTKSDWQDCARSLGKDRSSVGRRWKSLMNSGDVGLKSRPRRARIHGTWR